MRLNLTTHLRFLQLLFPRKNQEIDMKCSSANLFIKVQFIVYFCLASSSSFATTLGVISGLGQIDVNGAIYSHRSVAIDFLASKYDMVSWGEIRTTDVVRRRVHDITLESGFGYVCYIPESKWWLGGGVLSVNTSGDFVSTLPWGQASYSVLPTFWLQTAVIAGNRAEYDREGGIVQSDLMCSWYKNRWNLQFGGFGEGGNQIKPSGGGVVRLNYNQLKWQLKSTTVVGNFTHWIERETLLKYETYQTSQIVSRVTGSYTLFQKMILNGTIEFNKTKESEAWFGNFGISYIFGY